MNFKDEYKKEINELSPGEAAAERIRDGVMKRLSEQSVDIKPKKTPLLLGKIAAISAAACLVIGVTTVITVNGFKLIGNTNFSGNVMAPGNAAPDTAGNDLNGASPSFDAAGEGIMIGGTQQAPDCTAPIIIAFNDSDCTVFFNGTEHRYTAQKSIMDTNGSENTAKPSDTLSGTDYFTAHSEEDGRSFHIAFDGDKLMVYDMEYNLVETYVKDE